MYIFIFFFLLIKGRGGGFQDRNGPNRNYGDENNSRGGFRGGRGGDSGREGFRGGSGGRFNNNRGSSRDPGDVPLHLTTDKDNSSQGFGNWSAVRSASSNFEAGDRFGESVIPKETFKFVVSHIETANDFFIQLLFKGDELTKLSETLQDEFKQSPEISLSLLKENQICLAKSSDGCWYRGKKFIKIFF